MPPKTKAKSAPLRSVGTDEKPPEPAKPLTLDQAIVAGDYLGILQAQRREIVTALPETKGPALAAMHRQLSALSKEISQLEAKARQERDEDGDDEDTEDETWDGTWGGQAAT